MPVRAYRTSTTPCCRSAVCEFGPRPDIVQLNEALDWLAAKKLVAVREVSFFRVAALTELGADVGAGRVTMDGVLPPSLHGADD